VLESPEDIQRVSVASGDILELVAVSPREVVINGKAAGESSLILWQAGGNRLMFDVSVRKPDLNLEALRRELAKELGNRVSLSVSRMARSFCAHGEGPDQRGPGRGDLRAVRQAG